MFDLIKVGSYLSENKLWNIPFALWTEQDIENFCIQVVNAIVDESLLTAPHINKNNELVIPINVHPSFKYWLKEGHSLRDMLKKIDAPKDIMEKYCPARDREGLQKHG